MESAVALRVFRREATEYYGLRSPRLHDLFAAVAAPSSKLAALFQAEGHDGDDVLTTPDNIGGRYSVFAPTGRCRPP